MLCDNLKGGKESPEGGDILLIHADVVWQKPTQHCKAIILQLNINKFFKKERVSHQNLKIIPF